MKTLKASEFKARCLALMDEVARTGEEVVITKNGVAVSKYVDQVLFAALNERLAEGLDATRDPLPRDEEKSAAETLVGRPDYGDEGAETGTDDGSTQKAPPLVTQPNGITEMAGVAEVQVEASMEPRELRPSAPLADEKYERDRFLALAQMLRFGNPRQMKRLHNCYRVLKAMTFHRGGDVGEEESQRSMAMLFWLEYLYNQERRHREALEDHLLKSHEVEHDPRLGNLPGEAFEELRTGFAISLNDTSAPIYRRLKAQAEPFVLPYAEHKDDGDGASQSPVERRSG